MALGLLEAVFQGPAGQLVGSLEQALPLRKSWLNFNRASPWFLAHTHSCLLGPWFMCELEQALPLRKSWLNFNRASPWLCCIRRSPLCASCMPGLLGCGWWGSALSAHVHARLLG